MSWWFGPRYIVIGGITWRKTWNNHFTLNGCLCELKCSFFFAAKRHSQCVSKSRSRTAHAARRDDCNQCAYLISHRVIDDHCHRLSNFYIAFYFQCTRLLHSSVRRREIRTFIYRFLYLFFKEPFRAKRSDLLMLNVKCAFRIYSECMSRDAHTCCALEPVINIIHVVNVIYFLFIYVGAIYCKDCVFLEISLQKFLDMSVA